MFMISFDLHGHYSFQWFNQQEKNIGLDNGLVPGRRQTIIWTNDAIVYRCIYAPPGNSELKYV